MSWAAIVPLKGGSHRKSRLAQRLTPVERMHLSDAMAAHVLDCLVAVPAITTVTILSPDPLPPFAWQADLGRGLNREIEAFRNDAGPVPLLVVHADLPLLRADDIEALIAAAEETGSAIAPDRHGGGTNALALFASDPFSFAFGTGSFAKHSLALHGRCAIVDRTGLSHDADTPEDMDAVSAICATAFLMA